MISEGREEEEEGNTEAFRITREAVMCCRAKLLYLKDRGDGRGPCVSWFGDEGNFVLGQQGRIIPH
ncbi:hypothetical protein EC604_17940 [Paenibacillus amylolyticus]|uniref:Uncharacterized protein n=1 Tax=Paenibacillus amylolyticus TaxID=1451 RepID=A0A5M9WVR2_PAEAM|nr:hypothetical protein EC604_17940 [Paenibacillus amylolyticus]